MTYSETVKNGYTFTLFEGDSQTLCLLLAEKEEAERVFLSLPLPRPTLLSVTGYGWNADLSPWKTKSVFRGKPDFEGGADAFLSRLEEALPQAEKDLGVTPKRRFIAGYSLAGLFALYSLFRTDIFSGAVSASGSLWFDGFTDFMRNTPFKGRPETVYLSVGDREKIAKDKRLASVEDETLKAVSILREKGVPTVFELNEGNHFAEPEKRLAKGVATIAEALT